jgi:hypothetical protein|nr:MAG TPA: hypothetical protein [Caudoviricetes sp.]
MNRKKVTLDQVRKAVDNFDMSLGIMALVDVENMGFCKDGVTRWYIFTLDSVPCIYFKY